MKTISSILSFFGAVALGAAITMLTAVRSDNIQSPLCDPRINAALKDNPLDECKIVLSTFRRNYYTFHQNEVCLIGGPVDEHSMQFIIYDHPGINAHMIGIERVIDQSEYDKLTDKEKSFWHFNAYEVTSGLLAVLSSPDETTFLKSYVKTWGKTYLFRGEPELYWSFTADRQVWPDTLNQRNKSLGIDCDRLMRNRLAKSIK